MIKEKADLLTQFFDDFKTEFEIIFNQPIFKDTMPVHAFMAAYRKIAARPQYKGVGVFNKARDYAIKRIEEGLASGLCLDWIFHWKYLGQGTFNFNTPNTLAFEKRRMLKRMVQESWMRGGLVPLGILNRPVEAFDCDKCGAVKGTNCITYAGKDYNGVECEHKPVTHDGAAICFSGIRWAYINEITTADYLTDLINEIVKDKPFEFTVTVTHK